jgi:hypothetical protein
VPSDVNTSAIFLKKYMELDEKDRFAIGHRPVQFSENAIVNSLIQVEL